MFRLVVLPCFNLCMVHVKKIATAFLYHTFMKIVPHFYDLCPEVPGYGIAVLFAKRAAIW